MEGARHVFWIAKNMFCIKESSDVHARDHCVSLRLSCKSMDVRLLISIVLVSKK